MKILIRYFWNILISIDQMANTILGGSPDETISSRLGKWLDLPKNTWRYKIAKMGCKFLNLFQDHHCIKAIEADEGKNDIL